MSRARTSHRGRWLSSPWAWPPIAIVLAALAGHWFGGLGAAAAFISVMVVGFANLVRPGKPMLELARRVSGTSAKRGDRDAEPKQVLTGPAEPDE